MNTSVRTNAAKNQPGRSAGAPPVNPAQALEQAALALENALYHVLQETDPSPDADEEDLCAERRLKAAATQVSLALSECRGPRQFHHHYRHDPEDEDALLPVSGPSPLATLAHVCEEVYAECQAMVGMKDAAIMHARAHLMQGLRGFLKQWEQASAGA